MQTCPAFERERPRFILVPGGFHPRCTPKTPPFLVPPPPFPGISPRAASHCRRDLEGVQERCYLRAAPEATLLVMSEVVFRRLLVTSSWLRGTELARVETRSRSWWSSLRLRRSRLL